MAGFYGQYPNYGAIFVANRNTRRECFDSHLFGAPSTCLPFVKQIKTGMALFLFQCDTKKLYGVFQATTDGSWNILPDAYRRSGGLFPAQVKFRVTWKCQPLSEDEFRGAIEENYYTQNKFYFGLSKDQVHRLLSLFYHKKITVLRSLNEDKMNRKPPKSLNKENDCGSGRKRTLEEGEIEISEAGTPPHSDAASAASSFTGTLSFPLEKEPVNVSSGTPSCLEDYIPLPSPDHDDVEEKVTRFIDYVSEEYQLKSAKGSYYEEPSLCEESIVPKVFGKKDLNRELVSDGSKKQISPVHKKEEKNLVIKGLYADSDYERKSVFSRLNLVISPPAAVESKPAVLEIKPAAIKRSSTVETKPAAIKRSSTVETKPAAIKRSSTVETKPAAAENKDDIETPDGLMKKLQELHKKWNKFRKGNGKGKEDRSMRNRASAFSRLSVTLGEPNEKKRKIKPWDEPNTKHKEMLPPEKKLRQSVFLRLQNVLKKNQVPMNEDASRAEKVKNSEISTCLVSNKTPSEEKSDVNEKEKSGEEGSTKSEILQKSEIVVELSPKPLLTYYRRRRRHLSKESKLSVGANGEDAEKEIVSYEEKVQPVPVSV